MELIDFETTQIDYNCKYICIERSDEYLREFKIAYPDVFSNISVIVDDFKRGQGEVSIEGYTIPVYDMTFFEKIDLKKYKIIIMSDYYMQAFNNFKSKYENDCAVYYYLNSRSKQELKYKTKFEKDALQDLLIFRSGPHETAYVRGMDFYDNARALFEYMLVNGYNKQYKMVWLVKNPDDFKKYFHYENVLFYSFDWPESGNDNQKEMYYDALFHAKYLFFTDAYGFARNCRDNQIRVQLWHGCGLKTRTNFVPCETRYEYNVVVSKKYKELHEKMFVLRPDQVLATGHPKIDWLFHPVDKNILYKLGIPDSDKYIYWLPTFRIANDKLKQLNEFVIESETGLPILYNQRDLEQLNSVLKAANIVMVIKLHPFQKKDTINCVELSNIVLLENDQLIDVDVHINQLLGRADALISDYSSAAIDYLSLDRPIAFTLDDVNEYKSSRGFHFDNIEEWLPGKELYNFDDFINYVEEIGKNIDSTKNKRNTIGSVLNNFSDDCNSYRILKTLGI